MLRKFKKNEENTSNSSSMQNLKNIKIDIVLNGKTISITNKNINLFNGSSSILFEIFHQNKRAIDLILEKNDKTDLYKLYQLIYNEYLFHDKIVDDGKRTLVYWMALFKMPITNDEVIDQLALDFPSIRKSIWSSDSVGKTPLMLYAEQGDIDSIAFLLDQGASFSRRSNKNNTFLDYAAYNGHLEIIRKWLPAMASKHPTQVLSIFENAARNNKINVMNFILQSQLQNCNADYSLIIAAQYGQLDIAQTLITQGAKVEYDTEHGDSALFIAVENHHPALIKYLSTTWLDNYVTSLQQKTSDYDFIGTEIAGSIHGFFKSFSTPLPKDEPPYYSNSRKILAAKQLKEVILGNTAVNTLDKYMDEYQHGDVYDHLRTIYALVKNFVEGVNGVNEAAIRIKKGRYSNRTTGSAM